MSHHRVAAANAARADARAARGAAAPQHGGEHRGVECADGKWAGFVPGGWAADGGDRTTAAYSGTLVDDNARPVVGRTLELHVFWPSNRKAIAAEQTDKAGRFRFTGVPANMPVQFRIGDENSRPESYVDNDDRLFKPGEVKENDQLKLCLRDSSSRNAQFRRAAGQEHREDLP